MSNDSTRLEYTGFSDESKAFFIVGKKTVIVDTSTPGNAQNILNALGRLGIASESISLIILTHAHVDHFGSVRALNDVLHVPVAIGKADAKYIMAGENAPIIPRSAIGEVAAREIASHKVDGASIAVRPDIMVDGPLDLVEFGVDAEAFPTSGHTFGSLSIAVRGGDCAIGDLLMGMPPSNKPGLPIFAEDMDGVGPSLKKVLDLDPVGLCPAHGNRIEASEARKRFAGIMS